MSINSNIKSLLRETRKTQAALAEFIGAPKSSVGNWCKSGLEVPSRYIPDIARFFGIPISGLFQEYVSASVIHDIIVHDGAHLSCPRCGNTHISELDKSCGNCGLPLVNYCTNPDCRNNTGWDDPVCLPYETCYCPECGAETTLFASHNIQKFEAKVQGEVLTDDEHDLLEIFRGLDKSGKRIMLGYAEQTRLMSTGHAEPKKQTG